MQALAALALCVVGLFAAVMAAAAWRWITADEATRRRWREEDERLYGPHDERTEH